LSRIFIVLVNVQALAGLKAINAAIEAGQWTKAIQIVSQSHLNAKEAKPLFLKIAAQMAKIKKYDEAETYYIKAEAAPKVFVTFVCTPSLCARL
jgi:hypothetical protein